MNWSETPSGTIVGAVQRFLVALGDDANVVANRINSDPDFLQDLALFARNGGYQPSASQKRARRIMGSNFFGVEEAMRHFGVKPSKQQLASLTEIPFALEVLIANKDTHVLVAVFPLSILDVRSKVSASNLFYNQDWYNRERFAKTKGELGWRLIRKKPVANSTNKTWREQQVLLSQDEETPKAQVVVYTTIGHFLATGERLFEEVYVRCSDLDSNGPHVHVLVGVFDAGGLYVNYHRDNDRNSFLGASSARKN